MRICISLHSRYAVASSQSRHCRSLLRTISLLLTVVFCLHLPLPPTWLLSASSCLLANALSLRIRARVAYKGTYFAGFQTQQGRSAKTRSSKSDKGGKSNNKKGDGDKGNSKSLTSSHPRTVQSCLEQVISDCLVHYARSIGLAGSHDTQRQPLELRVQVVAAGRTDSGVHARNQAIHINLLRNADFDSENYTQQEEPALDNPREFNKDSDDTDLALDATSIATTGNKHVNDTSLLPVSLPTLQRAIQQRLPTDIFLYNLQHIPATPITSPTSPRNTHAWNVLYQSTSKIYSYRLCINPVMHPIERHTRWHPDQVHTWFDLDLFEQAMQLFVGRHNFASMANAIDATQRKTGRVMDTMRTVYNVSVVVQDLQQGHLRVDCHLQGALYKQVRTMINTALDVCRGRHTLESVRALLLPDATRLDNPSKPAPPEGLTLEAVYFDDYD
jgi:tRNA pseudouridine(38-40) synthase